VSIVFREYKPELERLILEKVRLDIVVIMRSTMYSMIFRRNKTPTPKRKVFKN